MKKILLSASAAALLLGSCSKDSTELAPVAKSGATAFIASMTIGNTNETRLGFVEGDNEYIYTWDLGDMIGVSSGMESENIPFIAKSEGEKAEFTAIGNDLSYLGTENTTYYMVYPYDKGTKIEETDDDIVVTMNIPKQQRYRSNSIATMTAPAVAVEEEYKEGQLITFYPVASYIRIPVKGVGTLKNLSMSLKDKDNNDVNLSGKGFVNFGADEFVFKLDESNAESSVDIDFGNGGHALNYTQAENLVFVIPSGISMNKVTFSFEATLEDGSKESITLDQMSETTYETNPNKTVVNDDLLTLSIGMTDKTIISNAEDFLRYVYAINNEIDNAPTDLKWNDDGTDKFKTAVIINNIDCSVIDDMYVSELPEDMKNAYLWYLNTNNVDTNKGSFVFPDDVEYALVGSGDNVTISDMSVTTSGNGIFADNVKASIKNLVIENANVFVKSEDLADDASCIKFIADTNVPFVDSQISGGEITILDNADDKTFSAALVGSVNATEVNAATDLVKGDYPKYDDVEILIAETLSINDSADLSDYANGTPRFGQILGDKEGAIVTVKDVKTENVKTSIMDIIAETDDAKYFSVIVDNNNDTVISLWTGLKGGTMGYPSTAEALANAVSTASIKSVVLKNHIDLCEKPWVSGTSTTALTLNGNSYKISNVLVTNYDEEGVTATLTKAQYYSMFGLEANVTALNVENLTIDVIGDDKVTKPAACYVGGLAYKGSASDVNISNVEIKVAENVKLYAESDGTSYIGGLISVMTGDSRNYTAKNDVTFDVPEDVKTGNTFAKSLE